MKPIFKTYFLIFTGLIGLSACSASKIEVKPINNFDIKRYMGTWYEIARLDHSFERNLNNVTATYTLQPNGTVEVINRGFDSKKNIWKQAKGKAKLASTADIGALKVSFFGPFYAPYNIIELDQDYKYVLIVGDNLNYLWLLSRETSIPEEVKTKYLDTAKKLGFNIEKLIWVKQ